MQGFVALLAEINALAERSPGFVWRLQTEDGDATAVRPYADDAGILIAFSFAQPFDSAGHAEIRERATRDDACPVA